MTDRNRFFDDMSRLMTNAMGVAQGARSEAETAFRGWFDRMLADRDLVTREEFDAVREMAVRARTENAELRARLDRLDPEGAAEKGRAEAAAENSDPAAAAGKNPEGAAGKAEG